MRTLLNVHSYFFLVFTTLSGHSDSVGVFHRQHDRSRHWGDWRRSFERKILRKYRQGHRKDAGIAITTRILIWSIKDINKWFVLVARKHKSLGLITSTTQYSFLGRNCPITRPYCNRNDNFYLATVCNWYFYWILTDSYMNKLDLFMKTGIYLVSVKVSIPVFSGLTYSQTGCPYYDPISGCCFSCQTRGHTRWRHITERSTGWTGKKRQQMHLS